MTAGHADWRFVGLGDYAWSHAHAASLAGLIVDVFPGGVSVPDMDVRADGVRVGVGARAEAPWKIRRQRSVWHERGIGSL